MQQKGSPIWDVAAAAKGPGILQAQQLTHAQQKQSRCDANAAINLALCCKCNSCCKCSNSSLLCKRSNGNLDAESAAMPRML